MTIFFSLLVCGLAPWKDPRIHNFGNTGIGGTIHSLVAPMATHIIDNVAYNGFNVRELLFDDDTVDLGCGVGYSTSPKGIGVDSSIPMLNIAKLLHPTKRFERGLAEKYGYPNMCKRVTLAFLMHEQPSQRRSRILKNAARICREEIIIMDIHPSYKPSSLMKTGEPYVEDYLENFSNEVFSLFDKKHYNIVKSSQCDDRVLLWTIYKKNVDSNVTAPKSTNDT